jgi:transcriptional regulator with XRE-family HTH domain
MTQRQLAEASGVKQQMISKLEVGRASETSDIVSLAKALGVRSEWLHSGEKPMRLGEGENEFSKRLDSALTYAGIPADRHRRAIVSKLFGVSREAVRKWLAGESIPDTKRISDIAREMGVRGEWLLTGQGPMRYEGAEREENSEALSPYVIRLAKLIAQAPPEKVQAILLLLGAREEDIRRLPKRTVPSTLQGAIPEGGERRSGKDRRQNVEKVDFERRSGRDRRASQPFFDDQEMQKKYGRPRKKTNKNKRRKGGGNSD